MENLNENIAGVEEMFAANTSKVNSNFKNSRKLSIFGKSSMDSRRTTDFTLTSKIDENDEYEKKVNEEMATWLNLLSDAKDGYLQSKESAPEMTIDDLPENYRNILKDQRDFVNLHTSSAMDTKFEETYLELVQGVKLMEARAKFQHEEGLYQVEVASANAVDQLFS